MYPYYTNLLELVLGVDYHFLMIFLLLLFNSRDIFIFSYNFINNLIISSSLSFKIFSLCFKGLIWVFLFGNYCLVIDIFSLELRKQHYFPMLFRIFFNLRCCVELCSKQHFIKKNLNYYFYVFKLF